MQCMNVLSAARRACHPGHICGAAKARTALNSLAPIKACALHIQACESSGVADGRTVVVPREQGWGVGGVEDPCNLHIVLDIGENGGLNEVALVAHALPA